MVCAKNWLFPSFIHQAKVEQGTQMGIFPARMHRRREQISVLQSCKDGGISLMIPVTERIWADVAHIHLSMGFLLSAIETGRFQRPFHLIADNHLILSINTTFLYDEKYFFSRKVYFSVKKSLKVLFFQFFSLYLQRVLKRRHFLLKFHLELAPRKGVKRATPTYIGVHTMSVFLRNM